MTRNPKALMQLGMLSLLLALAVRSLLHVDILMGLFIGLSIGLNMASIVARRRHG